VIDIGALRRAGYVGQPARNWWKWRYKANDLGIWPKSWRGGFIQLPNQILRTEQVPWRFGGQRFYFVCECGYPRDFRCSSESGVIADIPERRVRADFVAKVFLHW
jgi:hypothetical protein